MKKAQRKLKFPPWYAIKTHKQRRRYRKLARRAGINPDWVEARYHCIFALGQGIDYAGTQYQDRTTMQKWEFNGTAWEVIT